MCALPMKLQTSQLSTSLADTNVKQRVRPQVALIFKLANFLLDIIFL